VRPCRARRRLAEPLMLSVLLTRLMLFSEFTPRFSWMFCASPGVGGGETPPENWLMKLFRSKAGVNERSARLTWPPKSALSVVPANLRLALTVSRIPCG